VALEDIYFFIKSQNTNSFKIWMNGYFTLFVMNTADFSLQLFIFYIENKKHKNYKTQQKTIYQ
jgi:hypothetical protein